MDTTLPTAKDAEQQVIGAILLNPGLLSEIAKSLRSTDFVDPCNKSAFMELVRMHRDRVPIDPKIVKGLLEASTIFSEIGNSAAAYLAEAGRAVTTTAHATYYAELVAEAGTKRRVHDIASTAAEAALNGKASSEILADLGADLEDVRRDSGTPGRRISLAELRCEHPKLHAPVVDGLFRAGETVNLISVSKAGKSWMVYNLAISIITGKPWLGCFPTSPGKVLLIDNELHPSVLVNRIPKVCEAMGCFVSDVEGKLDVWSLRGKLRSIEQLALDLGDIAQGQYQAIILDAKYRFATAGASENDNGAETLFYNLIDQIAERTGAAIVMVHHSSKGEQSGKRVTDVGSGAGAQSRAADCHMVLREHEEDGVFVLDAAVRSFPPVEPIALRWNFPLWVPTDAVDPRHLKGLKTKGEERQKDRDREGMDTIAIALSKEAATARQLREKTGISKDRQQRLLDSMVSEGHLTTIEVKIRGNICKEYHVKKTDD